MSIFRTHMMGIICTALTTTPRISQLSIVLARSRRPPRPLPEHTQPCRWRATPSSPCGRGEAGCILAGLFLCFFSHCCQPSGQFDKKGLHSLLPRGAKGDGEYLGVKRGKKPTCDRKGTRGQCCCDEANKASRQKHVERATYLVMGFQEKNVD